MSGFTRVYWRHPKIGIAHVDQDYLYGFLDQLFLLRHRLKKLNEQALFLNK